jgi:secondary thiamine-phosphate synthase enzyme
MPTFTVDTDARLAVTDVTDRVAAALPDDVRGTATVFVRHTTAGLLVNEAEPRLVDDIESFLADAVADEGWRHDDLDGNADSHLRAALTNASVVVPVADGELDLGRWQSILFVECDGPRTRTVDVR